MRIKLESRINLKTFRGKWTNGLRVIAIYIYGCVVKGDEYANLFLRRFWGHKEKTV